MTFLTLVQSPSTHWNKPALAVAICCLLSACGSDSDSKSNNNPAPDNPTAVNDVSLQGVWLAPAYGDALNVSANRVEQYQYVDGYCQRLQTLTGSDADLAAASFVIENQQLFQQPGIADTMTVWQRYDKADALPLDCSDEHRLTSIEDSGYEFDASRELDIFIATFEQLYPSFEQRGVDWQALAVTARQEVAANPTVAGLFEAMAGMITPLQDSHAEVRIPEDDVDTTYNVVSGQTFDLRLADEFTAIHGPIDSESQYLAYLQYYEQQLDLMNQLRFAYASNEPVLAANDTIGWYRIDEQGHNIGVLVIDGMSGFIEGEEEVETLAQFQQQADVVNSTLQQAITNLADTDALILDIRNNHGGHDEVSQIITRYFMDTERTLYSKQARLGNGRTELVDIRLTPADNSYLKPVVLLTSKDTVSAAEVFTLAMASLPQVTVMGETTQGALADIVSKQLPSGIEFDLVTEYYLSVDGEWFEGSGIPVAIDVPFSTLEQRQQQTDAGIETAWQWLTNN